MIDTNETIAGIIAEMRALSNPISDGIIAIDGRSIADRLEAAHRRERDGLKKQVGDAAKLREAIRKINNLCGIGVVDISSFEIGSICDDALAAPARNCDVYSADELKVIFKRELVSELPIANEHEKNLITITAMRVIDTLFATTKEGGSDGK